MTDEFTEGCYNCFGNTECGIPMPGCLLCRTYGNSFGQLKKEYRFKSVTIKDKKGKSHIFTPPSYKCLMCKDLGVFDKQVWVSSMATDSCSDNGLHLMPVIKVPCCICHNDAFEAVMKVYTPPEGQESSGGMGMGMM